MRKLSGVRNFASSSPPAALSMPTGFASWTRTQPALSQSESGPKPGAPDYAARGLIATMIVLLGLFGSVEILFVVRKSGAEWRVEPQPYFLLINQ